MKRRKSRPHSFDENIAAEKAKLIAQMKKAPAGPERERLERKISQLETAAHLSEWLCSPGLMKPT